MVENKNKKRNTKNVKRVSRTSKINKTSKVSEKVVKDKYLAIFLAIISGPLFWIYTYKEDKNKLLIGLLLFFLLMWTIFVPIGVYIWSIVDAFNKNDSESKYYRWVC